MKNFGDYKDELDQTDINLFYKINAKFVSPFNDLLVNDNMMIISEAM